MTRRATGLALALALAACSDQASEPRTDDAPVEGETITRETSLGPVSATVAITPAEARLGDPLVLELTVVSHPEVQVEMPSFGEALGRFQIVEYIPRESRDADGSRIATQRYTLQAPMSGRQRVPPLRIEFIDGRAGQSDDVKELLTEELAIQVQSVLPEGEVTGELRPALGALSASRTVSVWRQPWLWIAVGMLALAALAFVLVTRARSAARHEVVRSAYDVAIGRLRALEQRGLPTADQADAWYVDLSGIIRRYLEDRFGLRAPELTTEEFLHEARRSGRLDPAHRDLLSTFLVGCDRVKFARYAPEEDESREALTAAREFLRDTRVAARPDKEAA